jgi:hypothetical protein
MRQIIQRPNLVLLEIASDSIATKNIGCGHGKNGVVKITEPSVTFTLRSSQRATCPNRRNSTAADICHMKSRKDFVNGLDATIYVVISAPSY